MIDPKRGDFKDAMTAHVKDAARRAEQDHDEGQPPSSPSGATLQAGDIPTLKKVMGALKKVKDDGADAAVRRWTSSGETLAYMKTAEHGQARRPMNASSTT